VIPNGANLIRPRLRGRAPAGIGPEFATHGGVRYHKANGIRDFLRPASLFISRATCITRSL
jgi:hypothetical protein